MGSLVPKQKDTPVPKAPPPPPPPPPPPTKSDNDVDQAKRDASLKKKYAKGYEKTILAQTGDQGVKKKKLGA